MDSAFLDPLHQARRRANQVEGRRADPAGGSRGTPLLALQRSAGNAAVNALLAARLRPDSGSRVGELDAALTEARKDEPELPRLEAGLRAAKALGVPVDIDGAAQKPPPSALAVTTTGFGPSAVADKRPVPPPKPVPAKSPLAKAAKRPKAPGAAGSGAGARAASSAAAGAARAAAGPVDRLAPPVPPSRTAPTADPAFTAVTGAAAAYAAGKKAHPPAAAKAKEAQDAAVAPGDDVDSQAKAAKVDTMDAQPAGSFDKKAFIAAVKAAIEAKSPKTLEEADEYKESGKAADVKNDVKGLVGGNKSQAAEKIETATEAPPDTSKAVPKEAAPLPQEDPGKPATLPAAGAVPKPAPPEQLNLAAGKVQADQELSGAGVTEEQLARSNEPEFTGALTAKQEAARHADTAPAQFRTTEAATLAQTRAEADATTAGAMAGMHGSKAVALAQVMGSKAATKGKDEARRAEVSAKVQSIFAATETDVKKILDGIDPKVDKEFEVGEKAARASFEAFVEAKMSAYKKDRYGGWLGGYRWLRDKIVGMPPAVNEFFVAGRELYLKAMDGVIERVATIVGTDLNAAKARIAAGKTQIAAYVKSLPEDLRKVGAEAASEVGDRFEQLESDVTAKQEALVDALATKYVESRQVLDDRIEELQAENAGLVDKAIGAIKAVIQTVLKLKDMLLGVLARAAGAVGAIISDPIGFLGKFVTAVKTGIQNFASNIWEHLKKGLQAWLFGALAQGGVEIPETLDLKGVLKLVASIFGLTWANIRSRIVARIGAGVMAKVEGGLDFIKLLATEGLAGIWQLILKKVGDLKEMVVNQIQDMVVTQIVKAGITWLISMLNPAGAFIKACKMIYDVVMFFVDKADQIKEFVDAVLDSVESIVGGGVGAVASKIEQTLAKMLPVLIGFLASLLGLGGISEKVKKIIETVQKPVHKAIDWVVGKAVSFGKRFLGFAGRVGEKIKRKVVAGKAYVKGKVEAGKAYVKGKARAIGEKLGIIRRPFKVGRESHTLSANIRAGSITMASETPRPVLLALAHEVNRRRAAALLDPLTVSQIGVAVMPQLESARQAILAAKTGRSADVEQQLEALSAAMADVILKIGGAEDVGELVAPGVGSIAPHSENSGKVPRDPARPWLDLESEHVIPVALVSDLFHALGDERRIARPGPEDERQHTILVYRGAASGKTHGRRVEGEDRKIGLSDSDVIRWSASIREGGAPKLKGRSRVAKGHSEMSSEARGEREQAWRGLTARERVLILRSLLPDRMAERVEDLNTAIEAEHEAIGPRRRERRAVPDAGRVRAAAMRQVQDIISIFSDRLGR